MAKINFMTVDVFTASHFAGNPLAVIPDARQLTPALMQRIASEFNYSETTFVLPPNEPDHTAQVRIFTPTEEIPFAGHPNVGTAYLVARMGTLFGRRVGGSLIFEEIAGLVKAEPIYEGQALAGAAFDVPQSLEVTHDIDPDLVAACISLPKRDLTLGIHAPVMASVGLPFALAQVSSVEALGRARPNAAAFAEASDRYPVRDGCFSLFVYARVAEDPVRLRARMFSTLSNIVEDPATGSAAAALGAFLGGMPSVGDGTSHIEIQQGVEIGRPSTIGVTVTKRRGAVERVSISGACTPLMRGVIEF